MSYCRSAQPDSDVYLLGTFESLMCFGANWELEESNPVHERSRYDARGFISEGTVEAGETYEGALPFTTTSRQEMIDHLLIHRMAGHLVSRRALERLRSEIDEKGDLYQVAIS